MCRCVWIFCINILLIYFLGAFVTLWKATISFVCLSVVRLSWKNKSPAYESIFIIFGDSEFVENLWGNFEFHWNLIKITVLLIKIYIDIYIYVHTYTVFKISLWFFFSRDIYQTEVVEKIKTHFKFNISFRKSFFSEIMRKNMVQRDRLQITI